MLCYLCNSEDASIHYIESFHDQVNEYYICSECAKKEGFYPSSEENPDLKILDVTSGLFDIDRDVMNATDCECPNCKTTYYDFRTSHKLGCENCYELFKSHINTFRSNWHGFKNHVGKVPERYREKNDSSRELARLNLNLRKAVIKEDYELAANLRDEINKFKKNNTI